MGLGSIVRGVIPVIKGVIGGQDGVMDDVTIMYWEGDSDLVGTGNYSDPVPYQALVVRKNQNVKDSNGQEVLAKTYLLFVEALQPHGVGVGRDEPIDVRDIITLSDGTTGPILDLEGLMDRLTSNPYLTEVYLG
jgi:hypothetical protein